MTEEGDVPGPSSLVHFTITGPVAHIVMNRPHKLNAINAEMGTQLAASLRRFSRDPTLRVAVLTGAGDRSFSTGGDLRESTSREQELRRARQEPFRVSGGHIEDPGRATVVDFLHALDACPKPTIAAVDGYCLAAGFECALLCDVRVATRQSQFGLPEPRVGRLAEAGLIRLSRMIPMGEALRYQLTGDFIPAQRAYEIGLVQHLVANRTELMAQAHRIAESMLACSPLALEYIKQVVKVGANLPVEYAERYSELFTAAIRATGAAIGRPGARS